MAWKDWSYTKRGIVIGLILFALSVLPYLEQLIHRCEPIPNFGGPNYPYCITIVFALPLTLFMLGTKAWVYLVPLFLFYLLLGAFIGWIIGKVKSKR